jgi:hypothetical protein
MEVVSFTPRTLYPRENSPPVTTIHKTEGGAKTGLDVMEKRVSQPYRKSNPDPWAVYPTA